MVVILNSEGPCDDEIPLDTSIDDPVELAKVLTTVNSSTPHLSQAGAGKSTIANFINEWLQYRDMEADLVDLERTRPSVVSILRGTGDGKKLMLKGHINTVSLSTHTSSDPLSGTLKGGRIYGRGWSVMRAGVTAAMAAVARVAGSGIRPRGDVILTAIADEEIFRKGTGAVLQAE